jgi:hypothetical protein
MFGISSDMCVGYSYLLVHVINIADFSGCFLVHFPQLFLDRSSQLKHYFITTLTSCDYNFTWPGQVETAVHKPSWLDTVVQSARYSITNAKSITNNHFAIIYNVYKKIKTSKTRGGYRETFLR